MHWPNVRARTATPVGTTPTCVTPGIVLTLAALRTLTGLPFRAGARHTMVGSAFLTLRSIAKVLRPVTASSASIRRCGVPTTVRSRDSSRVTFTSRVRDVSTFCAACPYVTDEPSESRIVPPFVVRPVTWAPSRIAAASSSDCRATAAATRIGV